MLTFTFHFNLGACQSVSVPCACSGQKLLSEAKYGFRTMLYFSLKHNLLILVTGLYVGIFFSRIFHSTFGSPPASFTVQKLVDSVYIVLFLQGIG